MTHSSPPPEVMTIRNWLTPEFYRISINYQENNVYINALKDQDGYVFELNIKYEHERNTIFLSIICSNEIGENRYLFCLELLNCHNANEELAKFCLNPETMEISCLQMIGFTSYEVDSCALTDRLYIYISCSLDDLTNISRVLEENVGIEEAVRRTIGDVPVFC